MTYIITLLKTKKKKKNVKANITSVKWDYSEIRNEYLELLLTRVMQEPIDPS